jgi:hypothetical protein
MILLLIKNKKKNKKTKNMINSKVIIVELLEVINVDMVKF